MKIEFAQRIQQLPPYLFADIDRQKKEKAAELAREGSALIDLGIGDPDVATPAHIVAAMQQAAAEPRYHRYPSYEGMQSFREAAAQFYRRRFGVELDPEREVVALIGSKEGIAHFPVAFVDPGDVVLVPDPGYPVYATWTRFVGGEVHYLRLRRENGFLPDLDAVPAEVARRAKVLWINYPNNPTAALASRDFYRRVVDFAATHNIIVASDLAYSEVYYAGAEPPPSFLEVEGAREVGIEFHSLSKTYNMTGWRIGFAVGNAKLVAGLGKVKTNTDSGAYEAVQAAAVAALTSSQACTDEIRARYAERMLALTGGLRAGGFDVLEPRATFYCMVANPSGYSSVEFASRLLQVGVVGTPANGFGPGGEGYVRLTVCAPVEKIREAVERIRRIRL
jgi:LL-diaminopimelate aminotransferase